MKKYAVKKTNKKSTVIIIAVLVILAIGAILFLGHSKLGGVAPKIATGLPVYPGSHETTQYSMFGTITNTLGFSNRFSEVHEYSVSGASSQDVINWYKSKFSDYNVENEENASLQGVNYNFILLKKGNELVGVVALEQGGETYYLVGKAVAPTNEGGSTGESLPTHDLVTGEEPIERYPGSVMLDYDKDDSKFPVTYGITYGTNDEYSKVVSWYKNTLKSNGWNVTYDDESADETEIDFQKGDNEVTVFVYPPKEGKLYTEIYVTYADYTLPDHDLVTGEEPIERYPSSVMIEYHKGMISYQGQSMNGIGIVYLAPAKMNDVYQWYSNKLEAESFTVIGGGETGSEGIVAMGQSNGHSVTVVIQFDQHVKYTKISLSYMIQ